MKILLSLFTVSVLLMGCHYDTDSFNKQTEQDNKDHDNQNGY